ncbi:U-box domain-containing protein 43-like [Pyrus ussuriensis x Pyrus communis]|uniref:U-box domain-containing protein 43-like n=1 Tax=Pyrus ussuriensis x Pyrus communis TaxID=2448454 RepID=A0A5N5F7A3_9ROSA|nr:U-box domain-containing protein 43-like [Pyrus ussuriensis x Pyrus communis]
MLLELFAINFTVPTNQVWQRKVADAGIIPVLVELLTSGTSLTKQYTAISFKQLSESSKSLSKPIKKRAVFQGCFSAPELGCPAHQGIYFGACEASLDALLTLLDDQGIQHGGKVLDEVKAIAPIIKLLSTQVPSLHGKSLKDLEMIFRVNELNLKYGTSAHMAFFVYEYLRKVGF